MKNVRDFTLNELREAVLDAFPDLDEKAILTLSIGDLIKMIEESECRISVYDEEMERDSLQKHLPSRKKKLKRVRKSTIMYNKEKNKKWIQQTSKKVREVREDTNNRSYLKKATHGYLKLKPNISYK